MTTWTRPLVLLLVVALTSCTVAKQPPFAPQVQPAPAATYLGSLPSPFPDLSEEETGQRWSEELRIGTAFAKEVDFYRAITNFKSGLAVLPPQGAEDRGLQLHYDIVLSYYLADRHAEAIESFEACGLTKAKPQFPGYRNLLIMLHDSYQQLEQEQRSEKILTLTDKHSPLLAHDLQLSQSLRRGDVQNTRELADLELYDKLDVFERDQKSVRTAQVLSAVLPGAGYWYVGQKQTAVTALLINAAFIAGTVHFFCDGNYGAGAILASLEIGWYVGGIDGAARAANRYNEKLWEDMTHRHMSEFKLYPLLMFEYGF